jgi:hypothetical protein
MPVTVAIQTVRAAEAGSSALCLSLINTTTMRYLFSIFIFMVMGLCLKGQTIDESSGGTVSYITSQNIYIKFKSTENIAIGDTLYVQKGETLIPALVVNNLSSVSAVCTPITSLPFAVNDKLAPRLKPKKIPAPVKTEMPAEHKPQPAAEKQETKTDYQTGYKTAENQIKQDIRGRISISSYSDFSNTPGGNSQRMRYTFSIIAKNIANTKLSGETYISFVQKDGEWYKIQDDIFNGLKIYSLALRYDFSPNFTVWVGRKINPRISNMGAIDGLQFETRVKSFTAGILAGSRPDYNDYGFNFNLFQYGAYLSHDLFTQKGSMQSSLAYVEQKNNGKTDRRFTYFQHSNTLIKNLTFFGTVEFDLYKYDTVAEKLQNTFNLTNLYLSLRYRVIKRLSLAISYSDRQNVIYFETYKNFLDQLLETESLRGYTFQVTYNPVKYLSVGVRAGYRDRKSDPKPSKNLYAYATYSMVPVLRICATLSATLLETSYISGKIYSLEISRDLVKGKLYGGLGYRYVDYRYLNADLAVPQSIAEFNLSWNIYKKLLLSLNYEGTFEKQNQFNRLYINLTQRF